MAYYNVPFFHIAKNKNQTEKQSVVKEEKETYMDSKYIKDQGSCNFNSLNRRYLHEPYYI